MISFLQHKLKAQALYFVIAISTIIAISLSALILMAHVYLNANNDLDLERKLIWNNKSALNYCLAQDELPVKKTIDLFGEGKDSVLLEVMPYGLFYALKIQSFHGRDTISKMYLLGKKNIAKNKTALYLRNSNNVLGVCGKTRLNGNISISERGIERSYIEGQNYTGSKLFYGEKSVSENSIPNLQSSTLLAIEAAYINAEVFNDFPLDKDSIISNIKPLKLKLSNPFLLDQFIRGTVFIKSSSQIIISANSNIRDCIIVAPSILIENGFAGSFQGFATDSIIVGAHANLKFPTNLILNNTFIGEQPSKIIIGEETVVSGNLAMLQKTIQLRNNGIITVKKGAVVKGEVYSQSSLQLKECIIKGMVVTNKLYLKTRSSSYVNQLLNVEIDVFKLDTNHIGLGIDNGSKIWEVLK